MASRHQPMRMKSPCGHFLFLCSRYDPISGWFQEERASCSPLPARPPGSPVACRPLIPLSVSGQRIRPHSALSQRRASGGPVSGRQQSVSADLRGSLTLRGSNSKRRDHRVGRPVGGLMPLSGNWSHRQRFGE